VVSFSITEDAVVQPIAIDPVLLYFHIHALILLKAKAHVACVTDN